MLCNFLIKMICYSVVIAKGSEKTNSINLHIVFINDNLGNLFVIFQERNTVTASTHWKTTSWFIAGENFPSVFWVFLYYVHLCYLCLLDKDAFKLLKRNMGLSELQWRLWCPIQWWQHIKFCDIFVVVVLKGVCH